MSAQHSDELQLELCDRPAANLRRILTDRGISVWGLAVLMVGAAQDRAVKESARSSVRRILAGHWPKAATAETVCGALEIDAAELYALPGSS